MSTRHSMISRCFISKPRSAFRGNDAIVRNVMIASLLTLSTASGSDASGSSGFGKFLTQRFDGKGDTPELTLNFAKEKPAKTGTEFDCSFISADIGETTDYGHLNLMFKDTSIRLNVIYVPQSMRGKKWLKHFLKAALVYSEEILKRQIGNISLDAAILRARGETFPPHVIYAHLGFKAAGFAKATNVEDRKFFGLTPDDDLSELNKFLRDPANYTDRENLGLFVRSHQYKRLLPQKNGIFGWPNMNMVLDIAAIKEGEDPENYNGWLDDPMSWAGLNLGPDSSSESESDEPPEDGRRRLFERLQCIDELL